MGDMAKVELQDGAYQIYRKDAQDTYVAHWAGVRDREREEFNVWFRRSEGRLVVGIVAEVERFHHDWDRWMEELKNSPTMGMELKEEEGRLVFEKFTVDCQKEGQVVTGEIVRNYERGVADVRIEAKAPSGGKVTLWYAGEQENGFLFWGIFAGMPLPGGRGETHLPTVAIRPRLMPGKMIYWAPSVEGEVLFTDGWEKDMLNLGSGFNGETNSTDIFNHRNGAREEVKIKRVIRAGEMRMEMERKVWDLRMELRGEPFFAPTSLKTGFPLVFPKNLVEVEEGKVGEELAGEMIFKMQGLRAILEGVFPEQEMLAKT